MFSNATENEPGLRTGGSAFVTFQQDSYCLNFRRTLAEQKNAAATAESVALGVENWTATLAPRPAEVRCAVLRLRLRHPLSLFDGKRSRRLPPLGGDFCRKASVESLNVSVSCHRFTGRTLGLARFVFSVDFCDFQSKNVEFAPVSWYSCTIK